MLCRISYYPPSLDQVAALSAIQADGIKFKIQSVSTYASELQRSILNFSTLEKEKMTWKI